MFDRIVATLSIVIKMVEYIREIIVKVEIMIDTNKITYRKFFYNEENETLDQLFKKAKEWYKSTISLIE